MIWFVIIILLVCVLAVITAPFLQDDESCMPEKGCHNCLHQNANGFEEPCASCCEKFPKLPSWKGMP